MPGHACSPTKSAIALPSGWPACVQSALLHTISLARVAIVSTRGWAADSPNARVRLKVQNDRLRQEVALLREELRIKDARMELIAAHQRPHYPPALRMQILELKTARGWNVAQKARAFLVTAATVATWLRRIDEVGPDALVQLPQPVNRFPEFARHAVQRLEAIRAFLGRAISAAGQAPKHLVCDKGSQFWCEGFKAWCKRRGIRPRFGAVGQHGSIAVVERLIKTLKYEGLRGLLVPFRYDDMRRELLRVAGWYNEQRPHTTLKGRTPDEVYFRRFPANRKPRIEPRPQWPRGSPCAGPQTLVAGKPGDSFTLDVTFVDGQGRLPIVKLRRAA